MPQPEMQVLRMAREATWGGGYDAGTDTWKGISVPTGGYGIEPQNTVDRPRKSEGTVQQTRARRTEMPVGGDVRPQVFPSIAQFLMDMFHYRDANGGMYSYVAEWKTPDVESRRHVGIMVDRARIEARTGGELVLTLTCIAKNELGAEDGVTDFTTPTFPTTVSYYFLDAQNAGAWLKYDDVAHATIRGFVIEEMNNLERGPYAGDPPVITSLKPGAQDTTLEITDELLDNDYRRDVRDFRQPSFDAKFVHPTGASIRFQIPLMEADQASESAENIVMTNPRYTARKSGSNDQMTITVEDAS